LEPLLNEPKTVMFMSVDLARSTAFKETQQSIVDGRPGWLTPFEAFFEEFPLVLMGQIAAAFLESDEVPNVSVWRVSGDDIIFLAEPRTAEEAFGLVEAFYRTVVAYDAKLFQQWPLRLKGCYWAARFPGRNIEIEIPEMATAGRQGGGAYYEYLGPDVDAGFRIASHAEPGHMIMSLNLAVALARLPDQRGLQFHNIGKSVLKGVFCGRPYPLILTTFSDSMPDLWQWESEESDQLRVIRDEPPVQPRALIELNGRIQSYLNRVCKLGMEELEFS